MTSGDAACERKNPLDPCLYKFIRWVCVYDSLLPVSFQKPRRLPVTWLIIVCSRLLDAVMAVGSQNRNLEEVKTQHKQEDLAECTHIEERRDELGMTPNEGPEVGPRNFGQLEKRLVRKLDWAILPVLWIMYWFK